MIKLRLERLYKGSKYTIGKLFINDEYFCDTIEDIDRGLKSSMSVEYIRKKKVYAETAIPTGTYKIEMTYSSKFKRILPLLVDVKGFSGIRIHRGNTEIDSSGCIIIGENKVKGKVINSTRYEIALVNKLLDEDDIEITIEQSIL